MSVLVDFVKFLLSFRNQDTTSFKNTKKFYFIGTSKGELIALSCIMICSIRLASLTLGVQG